MEKADQEGLGRLRAALGRARHGLRSLSEEDLAQLPRLFRQACSITARLEARGTDPHGAAQARGLVSRAHALLYRRHEPTSRSWLHGFTTLFFVRSPRALRSEWRLLATTGALLYGLALLAWFGVSRDLDLAPSLLSQEMVETEIRQLQETPDGEPFQGNFTFGLGKSPETAGWIMVHNMGVGILFFASALVPPLYVLLLATNSLMLGTYTAVAGHWGQAGAISSILWCHGVLEIQAILLAGAAGLCMVRAWIRPGPWTRSHALQLESRHALEVLAPVFPMLFLAGLIEGFVSPHAPFGVRIAVAVGTGLLLLAWALFAGRRASAPDDARTATR